MTMSIENSISCWAMGSKVYLYTILSTSVRSSSSGIKESGLQLVACGAQNQEIVVRVGSSPLPILKCYSF